MLFSEMQINSNSSTCSAGSWLWSVIISCLRSKANILFSNNTSSSWGGGASEMIWGMLGDAVLPASAGVGAGGFPPFHKQHKELLLAVSRGNGECYLHRESRDVSWALVVFSCMFGTITRCVQMAQHTHTPPQHSYLPTPEKSILTSCNGTGPPSLSA